MDCHLSRLLLAFRRSELAAEDAVALDAHLTACPACAAAARREAVEHQAIAAAIAAVSVPADLHRRLVKSASGREWAAWRRKVGRWTAGTLSAVALAVVGLGVYGWSRPPFATADFAAQLEREHDDPEQTVSQWLKGEGLPPALPADFDYRYHVFHGKQPYRGRDVPVVLFQNGPDSCRVYVLPPGLFRSEKDAPPDHIGSLLRYEVMPRGDVVYVFAYTGDSPDPFRKRRPPPN